MCITSATYVSTHSLSSYSSVLSPFLAPYIPPIDPQNASDTQNFDDTFLDMEPVIKDDHDNDQTDTDQGQTDTDRTDGEDSVATPSQSRSPSVHPDDDVDVFDGYSFKGRHSVIMDDDEEDDEDDESGPGEDEDSAADASLDNLLPEDHSRSGDMDTVEEVPEPKTPEARPAVLPEPPAAAVPAIESKPEVPEPTEKEQPESQQLTVDTTVPSSIEVPTPATSAEVSAVAEVTPATEEKPPRPPPKQRNRREKSGIPALDRNLADIPDDEGAATERDDDEDWDIVETDVNEERNGAKGTSLFARGVVDRYRLAVFRKSTPRRSGARNVSGISVDSEVGASEVSDSPTPSEKQRRGRTPLTFRRHPKQFLRAKSPTSTRSAKDTPSTRSKNSKSLSNSASATLSASTTSSAGLLTPSPSIGGSTAPVSPSLKSKESAISVGSPSESDQSIGDLKEAGGDTVKGASVGSPVAEEEKQKSKGLKKYKEGAEKVLSIFQSPR